MTKRLLSLLLVSILLLTLTACGDKGGKKDTPATTTTTTAVSTTAAPQNPVYYVTATKLNVRREPNTTCEILGSLTYGTAVEILDTVDGWHLISYLGEPAYISADYTSPSAPPSTTATTTTTKLTTTTTLPPQTVLYVTGTKLNVRSEPNTSSEILGTLVQGEAVVIYATVGSWYRIDWNGSTGYISADYVSLTPPAGMTTATGTVSNYPDSSVPPLQGGLTDAEREELYSGLRNIISDNGSDYVDVYNYVHDNKTYRSMDEGESIEQMAYKTLKSKSVSCYYFAAFTYLLMKQAGYEVEFVRGLGWQNGTEHCWIMFKEADGWYFMDSLYVRSSKLTTKQCKDIGYKWNPHVHPEAQ
ncbi:MAG: SH3 domain-containing protein [Clostridia bacterium]|nr:SH3 domain-containing protein [Clostridia bacterium]